MKICEINSISGIMCGESTGRGGERKINENPSISLP